MNASWMDTHIRRHEEVNINMFLNEMGHTRVAFVHDVVRKGLSEIADEQINSDSASNKFQMGTFSIHDLG